MENLKLIINKSEQWINIRGNKKGEILLFVHGGPGNSFIPWAYEFDVELWKDYNVIHWDQRSSGKSFRGHECPELKVKDFQDDLKEMTKIIFEKFGKEIHLVCHSWGSLLGLSALKDLDYVKSYIGVGQIVNMKKSQELGLKMLARKNYEISKLGTPPFKLKEIQEYGEMLKAENKVFGDIKHEKIVEIAIKSPDITLEELESSEEAPDYLFEKLQTEINSFSADKFENFQIPICLIMGKDDFVTNCELARQWFKKVESPFKKEYILPHCTHFPMWEKPLDFKNSIDDFTSHLT